MVYADVQRFGFRATCAITLVAGLVQIAAGAAGVARGALAVSPAVLHAMLAGIGALLTLGQVHVLLGATPHGSARGEPLRAPRGAALADGAALAVGLVTLSALLLWTARWRAQFPPSRGPWSPWR